MTTSTLSKMDQLRAALKAKNERGTSTTTTTSYVDKERFRFFDAPNNTTTTIRFLPDANQNNPFFWVEKQTITLSFDSILGHDTMNGPVEVRVPCVNMFEPRTCPIIKHIGPWWKGTEDDVARARKYYKKSSYIYTGFVVDSPFEEAEENKPENIIRRFELTNSLHKIIEASVSDPEMEDIPTDYVGGRDFSIKKTKVGEHSNYGTSTWRMKPRDLNAVELAAIEQHGLTDLSKYLGARPTAAQVEMIYQMFQDSLGGLPFDHETFGAVFRPYKVRDNFAGDTSAAVSKQFSVAEAIHPVSEETAVTAGRSRADDVRAALSKFRK